jgi:hypothetical protein
MSILIPTNISNTSIVLSTYTYIYNHYRYIHKDTAYLQQSGYAFNYIKNPTHVPCVTPNLHLLYYINHQWRLEITSLPTTESVRPYSCYNSLLLSLHAVYNLTLFLKLGSVLLHRAQQLVNQPENHLTDHVKKQNF